MKRAVYVFFLSSRRRHTRSLCDWSSDVCSSYLISSAGAVLSGNTIAGNTSNGIQIGGGTLTRDTTWGADAPYVLRDVVRSEERTSELQSHGELVCRLLPEGKQIVNGTLVAQGTA